MKIRSRILLTQVDNGWVGVVDTHGEDETHGDDSQLFSLIAPDPPLNVKREFVALSYKDACEMAEHLTYESERKIIS